MYVIILEYYGMVRSKEKASLYEAVKCFESLRRNYPGGIVKLVWGRV